MFPVTKAAMYYGERLNAWTHLVGAMLALAGTIYLLAITVSSGDAWKIASSAIYGATLVVLYGVSTAYHSTRGHAKAVLRQLDHLSIYLLIAGSYTPFCLVSLRGPWGWSLFGVIWTLAVVGMVQEMRPISGPRVLSVVIYATMGWIVLVAVNPLLDSIGKAGFFWLAAGGGAYTLGILFYAFDKRFRSWHGIWHVFVILGSLLHFIAISFYVV